MTVFVNCDSRPRVVLCHLRCGQPEARIALGRRALNGHKRPLKLCQWDFLGHAFRITFCLSKEDMDALAKALVLAVRYIDQRSSLHMEDDDVNALEEIASALAFVSKADCA